MDSGIEVMKDSEYDVIDYYVVQSYSLASIRMVRGVMVEAGYFPSGVYV
jgi:hypothetical protein